MSAKGYVMKMNNIELKWRVHTPELFKRIVEIPAPAVIITSINIFQNILGEVAKRATELNDSQLNSLMCRLALYSISDPNDKDFNANLNEKIIEQKAIIDVEE